MKKFSEGSMGFLRERVSYLKGLCEGMKLDVNTNEGRLLAAIIDVIDDIALAVEDLEEIQDEHAEMIESIDQDLAEVESLIYDDDDYYEDDDEEDDDEDEDDDYDYRNQRSHHFRHRHFDFINNVNHCNCESHDDDEEDDEEDDDVNSVYQLECPYCYGIITPDKEMFDEEGRNIKCPYCHKKIEVEWVSEDNDEDSENEGEDYGDDTHEGNEERGSSDRD